MKILYSNLPFKTNRNILTKLGAGFTVPNNRNVNVPIVDLQLPKYVYHMSTTPISEFKSNRIFYVSFSKDQAFLHVKQYIEKLQRKINNKNDTKVYVYTLKPRKSTIKAILFDKNHRPKTVSNTLGIKYNTFARTGNTLSKLNEGNNLTPNNMNKLNFEEGSGDNMIFGHFLCQKTGVNGIRNTINQDELAICNPKNFFSIYDKEVLDVGLYRPINKKLVQPSLWGRLTGRKPTYVNANVPKGQLQTEKAINLRRIKFLRKGNSMRYEPTRYLNYLHNYGTSKIQNAKRQSFIKKLVR
jgi:hypothetical protein